MWFYMAKSGFMSAILDVRSHFDRISGHFRSIRNFIFFLEIFLTKWLPSVILDFLNSLSIAILAISDRSPILDVQNSLLMAFLAISDPCGS